jgi:hypothetical protein
MVEGRWYRSAAFPSRGVSWVSVARSRARAENFALTRSLVGVQGLVFRIWGLGIRVEGLGMMD